MTDVVFGPALIQGTYRCPDCGAAPDRLCHWYCPRYAEDDLDRRDEDAQAGDHPDGF
jgi:hypothetical protein